MLTVIGLDYGTRSARGILVDVETGRVICSHTIRYSRRMMHHDLASADEYESVLKQLLKAVIQPEYGKTVAGICIDATSLTMVPLASDGKALSSHSGFENRFHAQIKLWKYHGAQKQAEEALKMAETLNEPFLKRTGGYISCEWMMPKLMEICDEDPEVYSEMDLAMDLCEFLTYRLTGTLTRSMGSMNYKGLWAGDLGFPTDSYLDGLRSGFSAKYKRLLRGRVVPPGEASGILKPEISRELGMRENVAVAAGVLDGHTALAALGALQDGNAALVAGTSNVLTLLTKQLRDIRGICGIAKDGMVAGLYGIDAGQSGTGDMLDWFVQNSLSVAILKRAETERASPHRILSRLIHKPWENQIVALDWWNGSRNTPCDLNLKGVISGITLETQPQDIYLALIQSIVCGTREIIDRCGASGIMVNKIFATGGMAVNSPLLMAEYANIMHFPIYVGQVTEGPALGAAIFAAVAAGIYRTPVEAYEHMGIKDFICYEPDNIHMEAYEALFQNNHMLRKAMVTMNYGIQK